MKKEKLLSIIVAFVLVFFSSCSSSDDDIVSDSEDSGATTEDVTGSNTATNVETSEYVSGIDLENFDIALDYSELTEDAETVPTDEDDEDYDNFIENEEFSKQVTIVYSDNDAAITNDVDGVSVTKDGADVTVTTEEDIKEVEYILSGSTSDGCFKIYSDKKFKLTLNGVTINNPTGAAINIQSGKRVFVELADGTTSTLSDGTEYDMVDDEDMKACFFSEEQLIFSGNGTLNVTGNYKDAISSEDYVFFHTGTKVNITANADDGISTNDGITVNGGVLNILVSATAANGMTSDDFVTINGGRTTIITTGDGEYDDDDVSASAGIKADNDFTINGGSLLVKSTGDGGKGISVDKNIEINGGTTKVITEGSKSEINDGSSSPTALKGDSCIIVNDGILVIRTTGDDANGLKSDYGVTINGGTVETLTTDDCINTDSNISFTGGYSYLFATDGDAMDADEKISIEDGVVIALTDASEKKSFKSKGDFSFSGGTVVGVGDELTSPSTDLCSQPVLIYSGSFTEGKYMSLDNASGNNIFVYKMHGDYDSASMLMSSALLELDNTYTLSSGGDTNGGTDFHGLITGGTNTGGSELKSFTTSSMVISE